MASEIFPGAQVVLHLCLTLEDGTVVEDTFNNQPIQWVVGDGTLVEGLEMALYGMQAGEQDQLTLMPEQAFGYPDPNKVHDLDADQFTNPVQVNQIIAFSTPNGASLPGTIKQVSPDKVTVDFNHPLAGHCLHYRVHVLKVG